MQGSRVEPVSQNRMNSSPNEHLWGALLALLLGSCASHPLRVTPPPPHLASARTELPLPPIGRVHSGLLVDGDPVWIVRSEDDEVRVLGARVRVNRGRNPSFALAAFDPDCSCFRANAPVVWNLAGEVAGHTQTSQGAFAGGMMGVSEFFEDVAFWMDRFDFERNGESIIVGTRWAATQYAPSHTVPAHTQELPRISPVPGPNVECPEQRMQMSIESALTRPEGQRLRVAGRVLMRDGIARLCGSDAVDERCPDDAPRVYNPSADVLEKGARDPNDTTAPQPGEWPWRLTARRFGDGFADVSTEQCSTPLSSLCSAPSHDETWVRTPLDADTGIWVEAPVGCEERVRPSFRMLRVRGRGTRRVGSEDSIPERCHAPSATDDCPEIPWSTVYGSIYRATLEHNNAHGSLNAQISFGIGGCFDAVPSTQGRLALMITDWRYADEAIRLVSGALERWNVAEMVWVSVEPPWCLAPGALGFLGSPNESAE